MDPRARRARTPTPVPVPPGLVSLGHHDIYRRYEDVMYKMFLATWRPADGVIRVVLVRNAVGWVAYL